MSPTSSTINETQHQRRIVTPTRKTTMSAPAEDDQDRASRREIAADLQKHGVKVDWQRYDLLEMLDLDSCVESAQHLREMGIVVN